MAMISSARVAGTGSCTLLPRRVLKRRTVSSGSRTHCMKVVGHMHRTNSRIRGYYDGRFWTLWKLPMFGCTDSSLVLDEIRGCKEAYPNAYIRLLAFDNKRKRRCQCMSFVIQKPNHA